MLIDDGQIQHIGDPGEVGREYLRLNFERGGDARRRPTTASDGRCGCSTRWLENAGGERVDTIEQRRGDPPRAPRSKRCEDVAGLDIGFMLANADGVGVFAVRRRPTTSRRAAAAAGQAGQGRGRAREPAGAGPLLRPLRRQPRARRRRRRSTSTTRSISSSSAPTHSRGIVDLADTTTADDRAGRSERVSVAASAPPSCARCAGPSALGGGPRRFFDLLWLMSVTEFKRVYFGTVLGYLWSLIRPLMLFGVLLFVFTQVFKVGSDTRPTTRCCC